MLAHWLSDNAARSGRIENCQRADVAVDLIDVDRQERNPGADQGIHHTAVGQVHEQARIVAAIEIGMPLRPDYADTGNGSAVDQAVLVLHVPAVERLDGAELASVLLVGPDMVPPGLNAAGKAVEHPEACLRLRLARAAESRPAGLVHRHALGSELLPAQHSVDLLAGVAVLLKTERVVPCLVVEHQDLGAAGDRRVIPEPDRLCRDRSAVHAHP